MAMNGYFTFPKASLHCRHDLEYAEWYSLTQNWKDKGVQTFPKVINPKENFIVRLWFWPVHYDAAAQHINHYTTETFPPGFS